MSPLDVARKVVAEEAEALRLLSASLDEHFAAIVQTILAEADQLVISGIGKSGNIAAKIAATLTSTGTPAVFMHPVEALHGDLGIVSGRHALLALSRSGNTDEILRFAQHFRRLGGPVVGMTQGRESRLAELCRHMLLLPDVPEAGPLSLAPTTSCALMLAAGDALAMALLHARGFQPSDFAQFHPEGTLGRRLLLRAEDLMHAGDSLPLVRGDDSFDDLLLEMTRKRLGVALIVESDGRLLGTFTDGDLRRVLERVRDPRSIDARTAFDRSRRAAGLPSVHVSAVEPGHPAVDCQRLMRESQITSLVIISDDGRPVGLLRLMDLVQAGLG